LKGDHPRIISAKFGWDWLSSFRGEDFFLISSPLCKLEKRGDEILKKSSPLKLLSQSQPNFAEMILGWSPFKIVSVSAVLYPRLPPLKKIEILKKFLFFCNGSHLGYRTALTDKILKGDHLRIISAKFGWYALA
jgi:hypothetical protein